MRLLIVEDENDLRNIVKKRLVKEHYSVDACRDGLEAEYSCAVKPPFRDAGYRRSRDGVPQIV